MMQTDYHYVILGGGPAGATLAYELSKKGLKVLLLEATDYSKRRVGESLSAEIKPTLSNIGLWADFMEIHPKESYGAQSTWNEEEAVFSSHLINPLGHTWQVDRRDFDKMLFDAARRRGAHARSNVRIQSIIRDTSHRWKVQWIKDGRTISALADNYVDATGRKAASKLSKYCSYKKYDRLVGIGLLNARLHQPIHHLHIQACPLGWWYAAPVTGDTSAIFLMSDEDIIRSEGLYNLQDWMALLPDNFRIVGADAPYKMKVQPAHSQKISHITDDGFMAVGDALVSFDPLYGSGVVRAIQTSLGLARFLESQRDYRLTTEVNDYLSQIDQLYDRYLDQWAYMYDMVDRWPAAPFWQRRKLVTEDTASPSDPIASSVMTSSEVY